MTIEITRLDCGVRVATDRMDHLESACLGIWVHAGARDETTDEHGLAHLLEHMAFKGTGSRTTRQIAEEIEDVGGEINAATSGETTAYFVRLLKGDVPLGLDILLDILLDARFDSAELEREQHVILQEIGAAEDTPDDIVFDHFQETAFANQILGRPILGTRESVTRFTPDDLRAYRRRTYGPERVIVAAAGAVDHEAIVRQVERAFTGMAPAPLREAAAPRNPARYTGGESRADRTLVDAQLIFGFEGRAFYARDFYASQVLAMVLGGGMSSRLFQEVREARGLCYDISAFHWSFSDTGIFGVHAATSEDDLGELATVILDSLRAVGEDITEAQVSRARSQIRASLLMSQESPASRTAQLARQLIFNGSPIGNEELLERLGAIDAGRLRDLAGRLFRDTPLTVAALGPLKTLPRIDELSSRLSEAGPPPLRSAIGGL